MMYMKSYFRMLLISTKDLHEIHEDCLFLARKLQNPQKKINSAMQPMLPIITLPLLNTKLSF